MLDFIRDRRGTRKLGTRLSLLPDRFCDSLPLISHPFNSLSNLLRRYSHHLTISPDDSLIDPAYNDLVLSARSLCTILFFGTFSLVLADPAWAPHIARPGPYFNINFPDGDTSFASAWPHISTELIIIHVPLFAPTRCRARAREVSPPFYSPSSGANGNFSELETNK